MKKLIEYIFIGIVIFLFILAASCATPPEIVYCVKSEPIEGVVCAEIYQPIRAPDGTIYSNSCYAEADGWDNSCLILINI